MRRVLGFGTKESTRGNEVKRRIARKVLNRELGSLPQKTYRQSTFDNARNASRVNYQIYCIIALRLAKERNPNA